VRLDGSGNVATSFGTGMFGNGRCARSKMTVGPSPGGVCFSESGAVSIAQAASATTEAHRNPAFIEGMGSSMSRGIGAT